MQGQDRIELSDTLKCTSEKERGFLIWNAEDQSVPGVDFWQFASM